LLPARVVQTGKVLRNSLYVNDIEQQAGTDEYLPFKLILLTNIQANYWWGQMHCGPPKQNFWPTRPTLQRPHVRWSYNDKHLNDLLSTDLNYV